jgi:hypothetical protein
MKKSKNNIIDNWLKEHGKELPEGWFENTTGCVVSCGEEDTYTHLNIKKA